MRPTIKIYVNEVLVMEDTSEGIAHAQTWAEMNSRPGDTLCLKVDHSWESTADVDE